jgi:hypothetical protein
MKALYDNAEVAFRGGGPFDGLVNIKRHASAGVPDCPPPEKLAHLICFAWGADRNQGKSIVGEGFMLPAVPLEELIRRADAEGRRFKYMAYKYRVESVDLVDRTLRISCSHFGTTADDPD